MRLKSVLQLIAALAAVLAGETAVKAHCGCESYPAACCPSECCYPRVRYRTCYQTVVEERPRMVCQPCYRTEMRECRYTVCKPVWEEFDVTRKYTVCKTVQEQHVRECRYTVCKPVWEEYTVQQRYVTCRPVYEQHVREVCQTCYKPVQEVCYRDVVHTTCKPVCEMRTVCKTVYDVHYEKYCVPGRCRTHLVWERCCYTDPCTGCTRTVCRPTCVTCREPDRVCCRKVSCPRQVVEQVPCTRYVRECHTERVPYTVCKMVPYTVTKKVPYTTCHMVREEHCRAIPCRRCKMVPEVVVKQVPYTVCKLVPEERCEVVKCRRCKMVPEVVVKQVPVTVCDYKQVCVMEKCCRRVKVCVPVCECEHCGFFGRIFGW